MNSLNPLNPFAQRALDLTRRRFFGQAASTVASALGSVALHDLLLRDGAQRTLLGGGEEQRRPPAPHFPGKAKRIIYLHMEGGPSQLDLFDYKPDLRRRFDQDLPDSIRNGQRLTGMTSGQSRFPVCPSSMHFTRYANRQDGAWISELMPNLGSVAHEICFVHSMFTEAINHEPAITFMQTGNQQPGRPSLGSWLSYGLGSQNQNLPTFVVMITQGFGNMQALAARFWGNGFLPSEHQGCKLRSGSDPVLYLHDPQGVGRDDRRAMLDLCAAANAEEAAATLDPEIRARLAQQEMAFRMQTSVPELTDLTGEDEATIALYGPEAQKPGTFASSCLLARRLAERGVRCIQLYMRGWDQHGNLPNEMRQQAKAVDQPIAGLLTDLRRRGMLDETLVVWGGEFGRTVYSQGSLTPQNYGRDHHPRCFTMWMAGGGCNAGTSYGKTDDYSYNIAQDPVHVHDLHATMLHLMGIDHERLTFRHQGRDFRLTDVAGKVVKGLLA